MAFLGILPEVPSFGTQLAQGLGSGLSQGFEKGLEFAQKMALKKKDQQQLGSLYADRLSSRYSRAIREIDNGLKSGIYGSTRSDPYVQALHKREALVQERDQVLGMLKAAEEPKKEVVETEKEEKVPKKKKKKIKFNASNKEHIAKMRQLEKEFKGDQKRVNEALAREFE